MGFLDRFLGRDERESSPAHHSSGQPFGQPGSYQPVPADRFGDATPTMRNDDDIALERYRYLLRTAPPERIEQAHEEAFAQLTPEQRRMLYQQFATSGADAPRSDDPHSLAQAATRSELRQPGSMERVLGSVPGGGQQARGGGFGSMLGASLLGTVGGYVIGSAIMGAFLPSMADLGGADQAMGDDAAGDIGGDGAGDGAGAADSGDGGGLFGDGGLFGGGGFFGDGGGDFGGGFDF